MRIDGYDNDCDEDDDNDIIITMNDMMIFLKMRRMAID